MMTRTGEIVTRIAVGLIRIIEPALVRVDASSKVDRKAKLNRFVSLYASSIGRYSYVGPRTKVEFSDIGAFCSVSWDCHIGLTSHATSSVSTSPIFEARTNGTGTSWVSDEPALADYQRVKIGSDVWIGARAIVMSGVSVGHGAVVAAGAIVTKDVEPYSIVAGVPAKHVRYRFSQRERTMLLEKAWWESPDDDIRNALPIFQKKHVAISDIKGIPSTSARE